MTLEVCAFCTKPKVHLACWEAHCLPDGYNDQASLPHWVNEQQGGLRLIPCCSVQCQCMSIRRYQNMGGGKTPEMKQLETQWLKKLRRHTDDGLENPGSRPPRSVPGDRQAGKGRIDAAKGHRSAVGSSPEGTPQKVPAASASAVVRPDDTPQSADRSHAVGAAGPSREDGPLPYAHGMSDEPRPSKKVKKSGRKDASTKVSLKVPLPRGRAVDPDAAKRGQGDVNIEAGRDLAIARVPPAVERVVPPELAGKGKRKGRDTSAPGPSKKRRLEKRAGGPDRGEEGDQGDSPRHGADVGRMRRAGQELEAVREGSPASPGDEGARRKDKVEELHGRSGEAREERRSVDKEHLGGMPSAKRVKSGNKEEYVYSDDWRKPLNLMDWPGDKTGRLCYTPLVDYVMETQSVNKRTVDGLHQMWFRELLKRAAGYTRRAAVRVINNRQPVQLQTRPFLESRVEDLKQVYDKEEAKPAIVVIQDRRDDSADDFSAAQAIAGGQVEREWREGNPKRLFKLIEDKVSEERRVYAFTCVGNHSTEAASRAGVDRRAAFIFFRSHLRDEDFVFLSKTENEIARAAAATTAAYDEYARPTKLIPFLRDIWMRHGCPTAKGSAKSEYLAYIRNVDGVLEREAPEVDDQGDTWWTRCEEVRERYAIQVEDARQLDGRERTDALTKVGTAFDIQNGKRAPSIIRLYEYCNQCLGTSARARSRTSRAPTFWESASHQQPPRICVKATMQTRRPIGVHRGRPYVPPPQSDVHYIPAARMHHVPRSPGVHNWRWSIPSMTRARSRTRAGITHPLHRRIACLHEL